MEVRNDREVESSKQREQMVSRYSSVNAKFMLHGEDVDILRSQEIRCPTLTGEILFGDFDPHIRRISVTPRPIIHCNDETFRPGSLLRQSHPEVVGECS